MFLKMRDHLTVLRARPPSLQTSPASPLPVNPKLLFCHPRHPPSRRLGQPCLAGSCLTAPLHESCARYFPFLKHLLSSSSWPCSSSAWTTSPSTLRWQTTTFLFPDSARLLLPQKSSLSLCMPYGILHSRDHTLLGGSLLERGIGPIHLRTILNDS